MGSHIYTWTFIVSNILFLVYVIRCPKRNKYLRSNYVCRRHKSFLLASRIKKLFSTVNEELEKLGGWFTASRLLLNIKKTKYTFFP